MALVNLHELEDKILDFKLYVQHICGKFDIQVEFDGANAHTDGKVITLPNLIGLSEKELDCLYGILLHEAGHIKYSDFSADYFANFKTQAHAILANALEDARIENLLMKEYDGAIEIFDNLYNNYMNDKNMVKRIFGFEKESGNLFSSLSLYLHQYYIKLPIDSKSKDSAEKNLSKKLNIFLDKYDIPALLKNTLLITTKDVISLSSKIYNFYIEETKDLSDQNNIQDMKLALDKELPDLIKKLADTIEKSKNKINELKVDEAKLNAEINEIAKKIEPELDILQKEYDALEKEYMEIEDFESSNQFVSKKEKSLKSLEDRNNRKKERIDELNELKKSLEEKIANSDHETTNEKKLAKIQKMKDKISTYNDKIDKLSVTDEKLSLKAETIKSYLNDAKNEDFKKLQEKYSSKTNEELEDISTKINEKMEKLSSKIADLENPISDLHSKSREIRDKIRQERMNLSEESVDGIKEIQNQISNAELPMNILPEFTEIPGWDEANIAQREWDDIASQESNQIVINGGAVGSDIRDVLLMLDKTKEQMNKIDLSELFQKKFNTSKIDLLNDISSFNNVIETKESIEKGLGKRHIPFTTSYDKLTMKTHGNNPEISAIKTKNQVIIKKLKEIIANKLKFKKKDFFKGGKEEGQLDNRNLWKLATKQDNDYFEINQPKPMNETVASIVIDISGSMDKAHTDHGEKLKELSIIISESLSGSFIKHEISGFHAPISPEMISQHASSSSYNRTSNLLESIIYKKFEDKSNAGVSNLSIIGGDNSDGESIKIAAKRLLKEKGKRKIMFIISDNKPFLSGNSTAILDHDLLHTIKWCLLNKIELYGLGFDNDGIKFYHDYYQCITDYNDLINFFKIKMN